ncbi:hypothetical protein KIPB_006442 [Kipferlia bialata]|uniref:Serine aminopeptidase S33 domain-containing protein n=1 Tax=Kipferlia bialata TaxID=797122 RepID=A0A9K3CZM8_9EUKA|nr:hypothetical protein KIPB_003402 [Kipferlia bialata]GIQ84865.1 hypothetical protein KIPB_006442 [Kipferlia bialata]|eukprot:g3402.t1
MADADPPNPPTCDVECMPGETCHWLMREDGYRVFYRITRPVHPDPNPIDTLSPSLDPPYLMAPILGLVLMFHGMGGHSGRFTTACRYFAAHGLACVSLDYRGHGRTWEANRHMYKIVLDPGPLGYRGILDDAMAVLHEARVYLDAALTPTYLIGHSMGSLLAQSLLFLPISRGVFTSAVLTGTPLRQGKNVSVPLPMVLKALSLAPNNLCMPRTLRRGIRRYNRRWRHQARREGVPEIKGFEWMCSDSDTVREQIVQETYGVKAMIGTRQRPVCPVRHFQNLLSMISFCMDPSSVTHIPQTERTPILYLSGTQDSVGRFGQNVERQLDHMRGLGWPAEMVLLGGLRHSVWLERDTTVHNITLDYLTRERERDRETGTAGTGQEREVGAQNRGAGEHTETTPLLTTAQE